MTQWTKAGGEIREAYNWGKTGGHVSVLFCLATTE